MDKTDVLKKFLEWGVLVSPDFFNDVPDNFDYGGFFDR